MLFQGQEFAASTPFVYFADHTPELAPRVRRGRAEFLSQFPSIADPVVQSSLPDPGDPQSFERCRLDLSERHKHAASYALHRDLLQLRREDTVFRHQRCGGVDGAVLGADSFVLRFFAEDGYDRLLLVNLGRNFQFTPAPEPLLAPPAGMGWTLLWSSEHPRYGGAGTPPVETEAGWHLLGEAAVVLFPTTVEETLHGRGHSPHPVARRRR
jgi:maltooligosyltrehalose trehalohydrolase